MNIDNKAKKVKIKTIHTSKLV